MKMETNSSYFTNYLLNESDTGNVHNLFVFSVAVRGVLNCTVNFVATFLNVSTIVVIRRYKNLQITSNALVMSFSIGNSLSGVNGVLTVVTSFFIDKNGHQWKIVCSTLGFLLMWQQFINIFSLMAISIERVYSIYFPLHAYKSNTFNKMKRISTFIIILSLLEAITSVKLGFLFGNFQNRFLCLIRTVTGTLYIIIGTYAAVSFVSLVMTFAIIAKLMYLQRTQAAVTRTVRDNTEYKITKMLILGKSFLILNADKFFRV